VSTQGYCPYYFFFDTLLFHPFLAGFELVSSFFSTIALLSLSFLLFLPCPILPPSASNPQLEFFPSFYSFHSSVLYSNSSLSLDLVYKSSQELICSKVNSYPSLPSSVCQTEHHCVGKLPETHDTTIFLQRELVKS